MIEHYERLKQSLDHFGEKCFSKGYISSNADKFLNKISYRNTHISRHAQGVGEIFDQAILNPRATTYEDASDSSFISAASCNATVIDFIQNNTQKIYEKLENMCDGEKYAFEWDVKDMKNKSITSTNAIAFKKDNRAGVINAAACDKARIVIRKRSESEYGFAVETAYPITTSMQMLTGQREKKILDLAVEKSPTCQKDFMAKAYVEACTNGNQLPNSCYKINKNFDQGCIELSRIKRGQRTQKPKGAKGPANVDTINIYADSSVVIQSTRGWKPCRVSPYTPNGSTPFAYISKNKQARKNYIEQDPRYGKAEITTFKNIGNIIENLKPETRESVTSLDISIIDVQSEKSL